jgi:hypothetical protein
MGRAMCVVVIRYISSQQRLRQGAGLSYAVIVDVYDRGPCSSCAMCAKMKDEIHANKTEFSELGSREGAVMSFSPVFAWPENLHKDVSITTSKNGC